MVHYVRHKTGQPLSVRLEPCMQAIVARYAGRAPGSPYVFPVLKSGEFGSAYRQYQVALNYYNRQLKRLAALVGLETGLSSYTSRHSWATAARNHEVPLPVISAGLGHTSEHTTRIYLDCLESSVIDRPTGDRRLPRGRGVRRAGGMRGRARRVCRAAGAFRPAARDAVRRFPGKPPDGAPRLRFISYICDDENRDRMKLTFLGTGTSQGVPSSAAAAASARRPTAAIGGCAPRRWSRRAGSGW